MRANKINLHAEGMPATMLACVCGEKMYKKLMEIGRREHPWHGKRIWKLHAGTVWSDVGKISP